MPSEFSIPPWLDTRQYDPVGTFMRAYQTGAQISEAQTRLAEQQRQANMEAQARQEQLQQTALHDMVNIQVQKAYHDQQASLENERLKEAKGRNTALAEQAAGRLAEQIRHNQMMESIGQARVEGEVTPELMNIAGKQFLVNRKTGHFQQLTDPTERERYGIAKAEQGVILKQLATNRAKQGEEGADPAEIAKLKEREKSLADQYAASVAPWTNAPAVNIPGPAPTATGRIRVKSPSGKIGTIPASQRDEAESAGYTVLD